MRTVAYWPQSTGPRRARLTPVRLPDERPPVFVVYIVLAHSSGTRGFTDAQANYMTVILRCDPAHKLEGTAP
jgi:hypothetical protein